MRENLLVVMVSIIQAPVCGATVGIHLQGVGIVALLTSIWWSSGVRLGTMTMTLPSGGAVVGPMSLHVCSALHSLPS